MAAPACHGSHTAQSADLRRTETVDCRAIAKLPTGIASPCPDRSIRLQRQAMGISGSDRNDAVQIADQNGRQPLLACPIAEFPLAIVAPRPDRAILLDG